MKTRSLLSILLCILLLVSSVCGVNTNAAIIYNDEYSCTFETIEDLKELASQTYYYVTEAYYAGDGPLVFEEDITIPVGLCIDASDSEVIINEGVYVDIQNLYTYLDAKSLTLNGELHTSRLYVKERLTLNGDLYNHDYVYLGSDSDVPTIIEGNGNIHRAELQTRTYYYHYAQSIEELKKYINKAKNDTEGVITYMIYIWDTELTLEESLTVPGNARLVIDYAEEPKPFTIREGCMLTLEYNTFDVFSPLIVEGVLNAATSDVILYYDYGGQIIVGTNGYFSTNSSLYIYSDYIETPDYAITGLDTTNFRYYEYTNDSGRFFRFTHNCYHLISNDFRSKVIAPDCINRGYTYYECKKCGESFKANYTSPTGIHAYTDDKDASCNVCGFIREIKEEPPKPVVKSVPMFRMYDPNGGEHFYTGSTEERDFLISAGWQYEGVGFNFPVTGRPVYRLYDEKTGEHLYTMSNPEMNSLLKAGWNYEGVAFNSAGDDEVPQYRLHNPNATRGAYHFTGSTEERDILIAAGWEYQGIGFYSCVR